MKWMYIPLAIIGIVMVFLLPFWIALGYLIVLIWIASLLYLIFDSKDPISNAIEQDGG